MRTLAWTLVWLAVTFSSELCFLATGEKKEWDANGVALPAFFWVIAFVMMVITSFQ